MSSVGYDSTFFACIFAKLKWLLVQHTANTRLQPGISPILLKEKYVQEKN